MVYPFRVLLEPHAPGLRRATPDTPRGVDMVPATVPTRPSRSRRRSMSARLRGVLLVALLLATGLALPVGPGDAQEPVRAGPERPRLPADSAVVELAPLDVRVSPRPRRAKMAGFHRRRSRGPGEFITRGEIERRDPTRLSDMLRLRAGVGTARRGDGSGRGTVVMRRSAAMGSYGGCRVRYWIDGAPLPASSRFALDELPPRDVQGIEIYRGPSEIPARFNRRGSQCGVVVVWTRDP